VQHVEFTLQAPGGVRFYYQGWQPDSFPLATICLVHGLGEHSGRYAHFADALTQAGYALLAYDLRGHGRSEGGRGDALSYEVLLDDIARCLDEAATRYPVTPRFLYGHSLGGGLVLNYALRRRPPLAGVIATSPWLRLAFAPPPVKLTLARSMSRLLPSFAQSNGLNPEDLSHDPEVVRLYEIDSLVHDRITARLAVGTLDAGEWALAHASEFALPLLIMHGSSDRITSAEASRDFARQVPSECTFKLWDGLYHETHNELCKSQVLRFAIDWLKSRGAREPVSQAVLPQMLTSNLSAR